MKLHRARPVVVEAVRWDGGDTEEMRAIAPHRFLCWETGDGWAAEMWDGYSWVRVGIGDYVVKDHMGRLAVVSSEVFHGCYEPVGP